MKNTILLLATFLVSLSAFAQAAVFTSTPTSPMCINNATVTYTAQSGHTNYVWKPNNGPGAGTIYTIVLGCGITDTFCTVTWLDNHLFPRNVSTFMSYTGATLARQIILINAPANLQAGSVCEGGGYLDGNVGFTVACCKPYYLWDTSGLGVHGVDWDYSAGNTLDSFTNHTGLWMHTSRSYFLGCTIPQTAGCESTPVVPYRCDFFIENHY